MSDEINYIEEIQSIEQDRQDISRCFQFVGISPLKAHAQPLSGRVNLIKRKHCFFYHSRESCYSIKCNTRGN